MKRSAHFQDMPAERGIRDEWVERVIAGPEFKELRADGTLHLAARILEHGDRWLRLVVNIREQPPVAVTVFFDRRLRLRHENQSG